MTVVNPKSISGITSITMPSGGDNVLTIHTNNGVERFRIDSSGNVKVGSAATISPDGDVFFTGVCTATTLSGAASGLTGALPAISAASLTNVPAANVVGVHTSLTVTNTTTTGSAVVGGGVTISESGIEASGIGITCANINGAQIGGRRNIVINGAMQVAQRGTSFTLSTGAFATDRFKFASGGINETVTGSQISLSTSTSPAGDLFRNAARLTNGNQTSGAQAGSYVQLFYDVEAQDLANSGWQYASSSSFITLSFYVRSSVAQTFYGWATTNDGTVLRYTFDIPVTQANTWTRVTKTISGDSNITINNDNGTGLRLLFCPFYGTSYTNDKALNSWAAADGANYCPDMTTTWLTTNDATFDVTGVQLEVGSQATPFEHRSFGDELRLCQRYCQVLGGYPNSSLFAVATGNGAGTVTSIYTAAVPFRTVPTLSFSSLSHMNIYDFGASASRGSPTSSSLITTISNNQYIYFDSTGMSNTTSGAFHMFRAADTSSALFTLSAEL